MDIFDSYFSIFCLQRYNHSGNPTITIIGDWCKGLYYSSLLSLTSPISASTASLAA